MISQTPHARFWPGNANCPLLLGGVRKLGCALIKTQMSASDDQAEILRHSEHYRS
jgi:hypothetical protein